MKEIKIYSLKHGGFKVLVDDEDYEYLNRWQWHISKSKTGCYAKRYEYNADGTKYHVCMHRVIMGIFDPNIEVDHIDHNGLNNQKSNLRNCSGDDNRRNRSKSGKSSTSKYLGVYLRVRKNKDGVYKCWVSRLHKRGIKETVRHYPFTEEGEIAAAKRHDELAKKYYGEFANLNFK